MEEDKLGQLALGGLPRSNLSHDMFGQELISEIKSTSYKSLESSQSNYDIWGKPINLLIEILWKMLQKEFLH